MGPASRTAADVPCDSPRCDVLEIELPIVQARIGYGTHRSLQPGLPLPTWVLTARAAVSNLLSSQGEGWQLLTAAAFVSKALPLLSFLTLQRFFVRGILAGSVKG
jgi:hypothetical protein